MDLRDNKDMIEKLARGKEAPITTEQGLQKAKEIKAIAYVETSALEDINMEKLYEVSVNHVLRNFDGTNFDDGPNPPSKKCAVM